MATLTEEQKNKVVNLEGLQAFYNKLKTNVLIGYVTTTYLNDKHYATETYVNSYLGDINTLLNNI